MNFGPNFSPSPTSIGAVVCVAAVLIIAILEEVWRAAHHHDDK
jgi:hypothetical protein